MAAVSWRRHLGVVRVHAHRSHRGPRHPRHRRSLPGCVGSPRRRPRPAAERDALPKDRRVDKRRRPRRRTGRPHHRMEPRLHRVVRLARRGGARSRRRRSARSAGGAGPIPGALPPHCRRRAPGPPRAPIRDDGHGQVRAKLRSRGDGRAVRARWTITAAGARTRHRRPEADRGAARRPGFHGPADQASQSLPAARPAGAGASRMSRRPTKVAVMLLAVEPGTAAEDDLVVKEDDVILAVARRLSVAIPRATRSPVTATTSS